MNVLINLMIYIDNFSIRRNILTHDETLPTFSTVMTFERNNWAHFET